MNVANSEASTALGIRQAELDFTLQVKEQSARVRGGGGMNVANSEASTALDIRQA